jgi:uncharacterized protein (DUF1330 family)
MVDMCCGREPCERRVARDRWETASEAPKSAAAHGAAACRRRSPQTWFPAPSSWFAEQHVSTVEKKESAIVNQSPNGVTLVVSLHAHPGQETALREYEARATAILLDHGGRLEKVIRTTASSNAEVPVPYEVHIVWFPSDAHLASYRDDPRLAALATLRGQAIASTAVLIGFEAEGYDGGPAEALDRSGNDTC